MALFGRGGSRTSGSVDTPFSSEMSHTWCSRREYADQHMYTIIERVLRDTISRIKGLPDRVAVQLQNTSQGNLVHQIIEFYARGGQKGWVWLDGDLLRIANSEPTNTDSAEFNSSMHNLLQVLRYITYDIYSVEYQRSFMIQTSSNIIFNVEGLRYTPRGAENSLKNDDEQAKEVRSQITQISHALAKGSNILAVDVNDKLTPITLDTTAHDKAIQQLRGGIAHLFGVPMSYLYGDAYGGLNSTGDGDQRQTHNALSAIYSTYVQPILIGIYELMGIPLSELSQVELRPPSDESIQEALENFLTLEAVTILDAEEKDAFKRLIKGRFGLDDA